MKTLTFLITPTPNNPAISIADQVTIKQPPSGAILRPLKCTTQEAQEIFRRTRDMTPSLDPVLAAYCLAGWQIRHQPDEREPQNNQWYATVLTTLRPLKSFGIPFQGGPTGHSLPINNLGQTMERGKAPIRVPEKDRPTFQAFMKPLMERPEDMTALYCLVSDAIMAGWDID